MKKISICMVIFLLLASQAFAVVQAEYRGDTPSVQVSLTKQDPDPVEPGTHVELIFKVDNSGSPAEDFVLELLPEYPLTLFPGEEATRELGRISSSQAGERTVIVKYKLKVADDAPFGDHDVNLRYRTDEGSSWTRVDEFSVNVQSSEAVLGIEGITATPSQTPPGDKTKLKVTLRNYASAALKDIKVSLDIDDKTQAEMPFNPIGSSNQQVIPLLPSLATQDIEFEMLVDAEAVSKVYRVPLKITYLDTLNTEYSIDNVISLVVGDTPDLGLSLERTDIYTPGSTGALVLRLVNKGLVDIKFLNVEVQDSEEVMVIGPTDAYIGELDSDDFSTVEFKLHVTGDTGTRQIPVTITYSDAQNERYEDTKIVNLELYSAKEAQKLGLVSANNSMAIIVVVVVIIAGYIIYRRRKKKKRR